MNNFYPLEGVGHGSETQLQVSENKNKITQRAEGYVVLCYICRNLCHRYTEYGVVSSVWARSLKLSSVAPGS